MSTQNPVTVAIVGAGIISPLGRGLEATTRSLRDGADCVTPVTTFNVASARCHTAGQIPDAWLEDLRASRKSRRFHRASLMMIAATREILAQDPGFAPRQLIIGATGGGMTYGESFYRSLAAGRADRRHAAWLANYNPQKPVLDAQEDAGFHTPSSPMHVPPGPTQSATPSSSSAPAAGTPSSAAATTQCPSWYSAASIVSRHPLRRRSAHSTPRALDSCSAKERAFSHWKITTMLKLAEPASSVS
jgi:hypothetical protein